MVDQYPMQRVVEFLADLHDCLRFIADHHDGEIGEQLRALAAEIEEEIHRIIEEAATTPAGIIRPESAQ